MRWVTLTGYGTQHDRHAPSTKGSFDAHLTKPADLARIQQLLAHPRRAGAAGVSAAPDR